MLADIAGYRLADLSTTTQNVRLPLSPVVGEISQRRTSTMLRSFVALQASLFIYRMIPNHGSNPELSSTTTF